MRQFAFPVGFNSLDCASALYHERNFIWLDSNKSDHPQSRYSYIVFGESALSPSLCSIVKDNDMNELPPFQGGYVGFKTYEGDDHFIFYHQVLSFDHHTGQGWFVIFAESEGEAHQSYDKTCTKIRMVKPVPEFISCLPDWHSNFTHESYRQAVERIITHILDGDIFQANLTQKFSAIKPQDYNPFTHYLNLRTINPAPYSAYMDFGDIQILSASPESFISVSCDRHIVTRPIKGTDKAAARLAASAKDRAENVMIVDLLRNDLSQICTDQSVTVDRLCEIQGFAGLHHLVSEISGILKPYITSADALNACSPGGSITGAPKIEAMKILREIEGVKRGIYCGSIGYIGMNGAMEMNIAIRTLVVEQDSISFGVGGGITALSDPESEYQETLLKADRIFKSFNVGDE